MLRGNDLLAGNLFLDRRENPFFSSSTNSAGSKARALRLPGWRQRSERRPEPLLAS